MSTPQGIPEEKNELYKKAFEIVNEIKLTDNIFLPENAEHKGKLIAELESIVLIDIQEKVKKTLNRPVLFVGDVCKSMLAGCYAHCVRKIEFALNLLPERLEEVLIEQGMPISEGFKKAKQVCKVASEVEGQFIFKDCFGQPIEKLWYEDDPAYCHTGILNPNRYTYTQHTGIKNWLEGYFQGKTLFLLCLEGKDSNECKEFVKNIRDMSYPEPGIPRKLIVHTNDINKLPEYFSEPFEVIELKPEKQSKAEDIPQAKENMFYCSGGRWTIRYETETIYPSNSLYLKYVKYLLENAYPKKFSYDELYLAITGSPELNTSKEQREETRNRFDEDMASQSTSGEMLDDAYVKELKKRVNNLKKEMEDAKELGNDGKAAELQGEIDTIQKQGLTYVKQDGKSFKFIDHKQKSKKDTIMKGVKRCIKKIKKESLKAACKDLLIWKHMNESIKLEGGKVFYMPKIPTTWN